jgi:SAM-dependent methyltransferase
LHGNRKRRASSSCLTYIEAVTDRRATQRSYDRIADRYATEVGRELPGKPLDRALLDAFCELTAGGPVADIACGPGHVATYLAGRGAQVIGLDLSPAMSALAHQAAAVPALAADMTALPIRSRALSGLVCLYAVIHLDAIERRAAYGEFARVLRPGGHALVAFHVRDTDNPAGHAATHREWWGEPVELTFRYLDPAGEVDGLTDAGLDLVARLDRQPHEGVEHASERSYLLVRRPEAGSADRDVTLA